MYEFKMPHRKDDSNKGTFGKVLNFAGSKNYLGAAYLSTSSALKVGCGYLALATEEKVIDCVSKLLPEAIFLTKKEGLKNLKNYNVIIAGCGLGINKNAEKLIKSLIKSISEDKPIVIDADGLNIISKNKLKTQRLQNLVITPHPLEAARLLECDIETILLDLENSAKKLTKKYNCITVLKNHKTIICDKNLNIHINNNGNSALAKAGSGDVLTGIIAGLLAQKMKTFEAAKLGVYIHSRAGEIASEKLTEYSVLASELLNYVPLAIKELI